MPRFRLSFKKKLSKIYLQNKSQICSENKYTRKKYDLNLPMQSENVHVLPVQPEARFRWSVSWPYFPALRRSRSSSFRAWPNAGCAAESADEPQQPEQKLKIRGIQEFLQNKYDKYYQYPVVNNLNTKGEELQRAGRIEYTGLYHVEADKFHLIPEIIFLLSMTQQQIVLLSNFQTKERDLSLIFWAKNVVSFQFETFKKSQYY